MRSASSSTPPPPVAKPPPAEVSPEDLIRRVRVEPEPPAWRTLIECAGGVGPLAAREALFRAIGDPGVRAGDVRDWQVILAELSEIFRAVEEGVVRPCVAREKGLPLAFAPYELTQFQAVEAYKTISEAVDAFFYSRSQK